MSSPENRAIPRALPPREHARALLTPVERLAVAYAPAAVRDLWTGLLALEHRLADAAREGRDPIMIQLRLAWWRDRFDAPAVTWPKGEPLLALLAPWEAERTALRGLVDGWEAKNVGEDGGTELARTRVEALAALARLAGVAERHQPALRDAAGEWHGTVPVTARTAPRLPRSLRPLVILRGLALRERAGQAAPLRQFAALLRLGLLGR
ncbi:hypothetical protein OLX02_11755 [Novosphingobium sp. KCTC 2891]|uniref:hypothetical protein n=1 Tax=Novosphingobium sp. KCTC 2891 TaxID=2989730 RepID=UPI002222E121|nr:hypothetical protein [Novosphingobium sp. KCTC 2891]MCW1383494.1 hypothetical protein [Novosphingobium sp. KCTC 2891]